MISIRQPNLLFELKEGQFVEWLHSPVCVANVVKSKLRIKKRRKKDHSKFFDVSIKKSSKVLAAMCTKTSRRPHVRTHLAALTSKT